MAFRASGTGRGALALAFGAALALSCCGRQGREVRIEPEPQAAVAWEVRLGSRGGFTGGSTGQTLRSDGTVTSWSQITPDDPVEPKPLGRASPEALRQLERAMTAPGLRALRLAQHGNMTAFLEWRRKGDTRTYTWPERLRGAEALPEPLRRALDAVRAAVDSARP